MTELVDSEGALTMPDTCTAPVADGVATGDTLAHIRCCRATVPHGLCGQAGPPDEKFVEWGDPSGCAVCVSLLEYHLYLCGCARDGITIIRPWRPMREDDHA